MAVEKRSLGRILFKEKPEAEYGLLSAITVMLLFDDIVLALLLSSLGPSGLLLAIIFSFNVIILTVVFLFVRVREVELTDHGIFVRFGIFRSSIPLSSIRSCSVQDPPRWNKIGLVSRWKTRTVYCFKSSLPFVKIEYGTKRPRSIFFNVGRLSEFTAELAKIREPR